MSDIEPEPEPEPEPELSKSDLREKVARLETENEILRAGQEASKKRRPIVDTQGATAFGLILAGIVLTVWSTLDPEVAFTGIAGLLAGGGLVATGQALR